MVTRCPRCCAEFDCSPESGWYVGHCPDCRIATVPVDEEEDAEAGGRTDALARQPRDARGGER